MKIILNVAAALGASTILTLPVNAENLTVFAASSLKGVLDDIAAAYEQEADVEVLVSYASSALLARQILQGAPVDVFISANTKWMDVVEKAGLNVPGSARNIAANSLVLIGAQGQVDPRIKVLGENDPVFAKMAEARVATGFVTAVPVGIYAKEALEYFGHWSSLEGQVVETDNARAALNFVALGAVPYGIVYATDARAESRVNVVGTFPAGSHTPIVYPAAQHIESTDQAADFLKYMRSEFAQMQFEAHGFSVVADE